MIVRYPEVKRKMGEWGAKPAATAAVVLLLATKDDAGAMDEGRYAERLVSGDRAAGATPQDQARAVAAASTVLGARLRRAV